MFDFFRKKQEKPILPNVVPMDIYSISLAHMINQSDKMSGDIQALIVAVRAIAKSLEEMPVTTTEDDLRMTPIRQEPAVKKNKEFYINQLEYARDKFTETMVEKNTITRIINKIKKDGTKHDR